MNTRIAVVEDVWGPAFERLAKRMDVVHAPDAWRDPDVLVRTASSADALVVRNRTQVDHALLESAPSVRLVARAGVGLDNIELAAADELGVVVVAALGVNATSVAEHAIGLALAVARGTARLDADVRGGAWSRTAGKELAGGVWGLLSAGATARATARLARGLGMSVVAHDPYVDPADQGLSSLGVRLGTLEEVVSSADVLSVHLPATAGTRNTVDATLLGRMKHDAILVNVGRGETVDEEALADALETGHLYGAGLDVRSVEPPDVSSRLHALSNVVLTPHVAGITTQAQARIGEVLSREIETVLSGGQATCAVGAHHKLMAVAQ